MLTGTGTAALVERGEGVRQGGAYGQSRRKYVASIASFQTCDRGLFLYPKEAMMSRRALHCAFCRIKEKE